jgi:hypothetical protein
VQKKIVIKLYPSSGVKRCSLAVRRRLLGDLNA